jgi:hypothetical protein
MGYTLRVALLTYTEVTGAGHWEGYTLIPASVPMENFPILALVFYILKIFAYCLAIGIIESLNLSYFIARKH